MSLEGPSGEAILAALSQLLRQQEVQVSRIRSPTPVRISNQQYIASLSTFSRGFQDRMDEIDRSNVLEFDFPVDSPNRFQQPGQLGQFEAEYFPRIREFLTEVCELASSDSKRLLSLHRLTEAEAKLYAARFIFQNVSSIITEFSSFVEVHTGLSFEAFTKDLTEEVDAVLKKIFSALVDKYPQAPLAAVTIKMSEAVEEVNKSEDENSDLIFVHRISLEKYKAEFEKNDERRVDYSVYRQFIMEVLNRAMSVTREGVGNGSDNTTYQLFQLFMETLFCLSSQKYYNEIKEEDRVRFFEHVIREGKLVYDTKQLLSFRQDQQQTQEQLVREHKYAMGQKLPRHVRLFSQKQLKDRNFAQRNCSVIRILTKWIEYLEDFFKNPEKCITQRGYPFKDITNSLVPKFDDKEVLKANLLREHKIVKAKFKELVESNSRFQSYFLSRSCVGGESSILKNWEDARVAASRINKHLIEVMLEYLTILIHHLLRAGRTSGVHINLVVFRISDLIRSKFQCSEGAFLNVLHTLSLLDSRLGRELFKLVRVKNKLQEKDNNLLINFQFLGKVQCELQLSTQKIQEKEKINYFFSHLLYELMRGKMGPLSECAIIISEYDSILAACKDKFYKRKAYSPESNTAVERSVIRTELGRIFDKTRDKRFVCFKCEDLIEENIGLFKGNFRECNRCFLNSEPEPQNHIASDLLRNYVSSKLKDKRIKRVRSWAEVVANRMEDAVQEDVYLISLNNYLKNEKLELSKLWFHKREHKWFLMKLSTLSQEYGDFNYFDVSDRLRDESCFEQLTFQVVDPDNLAQLRNPVLFDVDLASPQVKLVSAAFESYRIEKKMIKFIKFKNDVIESASDPLKAEIFCKAIRDLSLIKYNKFKDISFDYVKQANLSNCNLEKIELHKLKNLRFLDLSSNKLKQIDLLHNVQLKHLRLSYNQLESVNLSANKNLEILDLDYLNLSEFSCKDKDHLRELNINGNLLKAIRIENMLELKTVQAKAQKKKLLGSVVIHNAPKLEELKFDIEGNTKQTISQFVGAIDFKNIKTECKLIVNEDQALRQFKEKLTAKYSKDITFNFA